MIEPVRSSLKKVLVSKSAQAWEHWQKFWFESHAPRNLELLRRALCLLIFCCFSIRFIDFDLLYGVDGIISLANSNESLGKGSRLTLLNWLKGDAWAQGLYIALLASLLGLGFAPSRDGSWLWIRRGLALVAYVLHISFLFRNTSIAYGFDLIVTFYLAFLVFAREGTATQSMAGSIVLRLSQIQLCVIYAYSGLEKLRGLSWWSGDALFATLINPQWARYDFAWVSGFPTFVGAATLLTVLWETYFPALIWFRSIRGAVLLFGVALHLGIAFTMSIGFFGLLMIVLYSSFLSEPQAKTALRLIFRQKV